MLSHKKLMLIVSFPYSLKRAIFISPAFYVRYVVFHNHIERRFISEDLVESLLRSYLGVFKFIKGENGFDVVCVICYDIWQHSMNMGKIIQKFDY